MKKIVEMKEMPRAVPSTAYKTIQSEFICRSRLFYCQSFSMCRVRNSGNWDGGIDQNPLMLPT